MSLQTDFQGRGVLVVLASLSLLLLAACAPSSKPPASLTLPPASESAETPLTLSESAPSVAEARDSPEASLGAPPPSLDAAPESSDPNLALYDFFPSPDPSNIFEQREPEEENAELHIALLLPEARLPQLVRALHHAAMLALFAAPVDERVSLHFYDTSREPASAAAQALAEGADIVIGPLFAESVALASRQTLSENIPMLALSTQEALAQRGVWLFNHTAQSEIQQIVQHITAQKHRKMGVLAPSTPYGRESAALALASSPSGGAPSRPSVDYVGFFLPGTDAAIQVQKLTNYFHRRDRKTRRLAQLKTDDSPRARRSIETLELRDTFGAPPFDALFLPISQGEELRTLAALLALHDVSAPETRIYGLSAWQSLRNPENETGLRGARFLAPPDKPYRQFLAHFSENFQYAPHALAGIVYDAVSLAIQSTDKGVIALDKLESANGHQGALGRYRLMQNGNLQRLYALHEIRADGIREIRKPFSKFPESLETTPDDNPRLP